MVSDIDYVLQHNAMRRHDHNRPRQDKTRQREVMDAGTTVSLSPHLQCRYSDKQFSLYSTKNSDRSPVPVRLANGCIFIQFAHLYTPCTSSADPLLKHYTHLQNPNLNPKPGSDGVQT